LVVDVVGAVVAAVAELLGTALMLLDSGSQGAAVVRNNLGHAAADAEDTASTTVATGCIAELRTGSVGTVALGAGIETRPAAAAHVGSVDSGGIAVHLRCLGNIPLMPSLSAL
jgi:hypothetical protein